MAALAGLAGGGAFGCLAGRRWRRLPLAGWRQQQQLQLSGWLAAASAVCLGGWQLRLDGLSCLPTCLALTDYLNACLAWPTTWLAGPAAGLAETNMKTLIQKFV